MKKEKLPLWYLLEEYEERIQAMNRYIELADCARKPSGYHYPCPKYYAQKRLFFAYTCQQHAVINFLECLTEV